MIKIGLLKWWKNCPKHEYKFLITTVVVLGGTGYVLGATASLKQKTAIVICCIIGQIFNHYLYNKRKEEWKEKYGKKEPSIDEKLEKRYGIKLGRV